MTRTASARRGRGSRSSSDDEDPEHLRKAQTLYRAQLDSLATDDPTRGDIESELSKVDAELDALAKAEAEERARRRSSARREPRGCRSWGSCRASAWPLRRWGVYRARFFPRPRASTPPPRLTKRSSAASSSALKAGVRRSSRTTTTRACCICQSLLFAASEALSGLGAVTDGLRDSLHSIAEHRVGDVGVARGCLRLAVAEDLADNGERDTGHDGVARH